MPSHRQLIPALLLVLVTGGPALAQRSEPVRRPFGTLREQAAMQQEWLKKRLDTFLPGLMRNHGIDMWVVPMREYNEDPVFIAITAPETFAARRRTIYVVFDKCAASGRAPSSSCIERIALGGTSQGGVYEARRSTKAAAGDVGRGQQAELWGDEQWQILASVIAERKPRVIGINRSTVFAFSDGLSSGEIELQATTPVPEWDGQAVRMALEEDAIIGADGKIRWALRRQDKLFLVK
jgi:hypothetical protein